MSTVNSGGGQMPPADVTQGQMPPTSGQMPTTPSVSTDNDPNTAEQLKQLREENRQRRLSEEKALAALKKLTDAQLSEEQRREQQQQEREQQLVTLQQERQTWLLDRAVLLAAPKVGIEPELAQKLIERSKVKTDKETGEPDPDSVQEALKALLARFPNLAVHPASEQPQARPPAPRVPSTNPPASSVSQLPNETVKDLRKYTLAEAYKQNKQQ